MSYLIAFFLIPMNPFVDKWETECDQGKHFKLVFTTFLAAANKLKVEYKKMHDDLKGEDQDTVFLKFISASADLKVHIIPFLNRMELVQDMMNSRRQLETDFDKCINAGNEKLAGTGVTMQTFFFLPFSVMCQHKQFVADFIKNTPAAHSLHSQLIEEQTQLNRSQAFINTANGEFDAKLKIFHEVAADSAHGFAWQLSVTRALLSEQVKLLISATLPWYKSIPLKAVRDGQCDSWLGAADRWLNVTVVEGSIMLANAASEGQVDNLHFRNLIR